MVVCSILAILFFQGYKLVQSEKINGQEISNLTIVKWSIAFSILMTISIPCNSADLYGYIARGAQQTLHHQNPYFETVAEIKDFKKSSLFFNFMWPPQPTTYGPIFISITKTVLFLSDNNFLVSFFNFKLLNLIIYFLFLVFTINKLNPEDFFLVAFNPLIFIQGLWNGHNDLICGVLIFTGIYLIIKEEKYFSGSLALTSAIGVKYVSILILPIVFIHLFFTNKKKMSDVTLGILCGLVLIAIFSIDYIDIFSSVSSEKIGRLYTNIDLVHKSLIATLFILGKCLSRALSLNLDLTLMLSIIKYSIYFIFLVFYLKILFKKNEELISKMFLVLLTFFCFTLAKFHSWYLLNFILLIPLLNKDKNKVLIKFSVLLIMFHTLSITFIDQAKILNFMFLTFLPLIITYRSNINKLTNG